MKSSETINELAASLAKAQGEIEIAKKDHLNPHFKSKYADLRAIVMAARGAFAKYDLSIIQGGELIDGQWVEVTRIIHKSGQWIESYLPISESPQKFMSSQTYSKRYGYAGMAGVVAEDEDDDGETAQRAATPPKPAYRAPKPIAKDPLTPPMDYDEPFPGFETAPPAGPTNDMPQTERSLGFTVFSMGHYKGKTFEQVIKEHPTKVVGYAQWIVGKLNKGEKVSEDFLKFVDFAKSKGYDVRT